MQMLQQLSDVEAAGITGGVAPGGCVPPDWPDIFVPPAP
jgi:hypothetical protein